MKILTQRNGIALIAVLAVLLVLTLLLPVMFSSSQYATDAAVNGTDIQRAAYLARSLCEMAVGTYKQTYNAEIPDRDEDDLTTFQKTAKAYQEAYDKLYRGGDTDTTNDAGSIKYIKTSTISMYSKKDDANNEDIKYSNENDFTPDDSHTLIGSGNCVITYSEVCNYYLVDSTVSETYEITEAEFNTMKADLMSIVGTSNDDADGLDKTLLDCDNSAPIILDKTKKEATDLAGHQFTVSKVENKELTFVATANVNGHTEKKICKVILPTNPSEKGWLKYQGQRDSDGEYSKDGMSNEVFADVSKATGLASINYSDSAIVETGLLGSDYRYKPQYLYIFSCLGNMNIDTSELRDKDGTLVEDIPECQGTNYILDTSPGVNTTPNGDPTFAIIDGINSHSYSDKTQRDNFIAFTATNAINVDLPVNLLVNPTRAARLGDGLGFDTNYSIFKNLIFQANDVVFNGEVNMLVSFYTPADNLNARRMSSVVLAAPKSSKYSYKHKTRLDSNGQFQDVRAGKVFFLEDCYLYVINYADDGSGYSDNWYEVPSTVYYKDKDFTKIKIASAGDVYYYNSDITMKSKDGSTDIPVGFSLAGWAIETIYYPNISNLGKNAPWWDVWEQSQQALFGYYVDKVATEDRTYEPDDFHKIGNIYENASEEGVALPDTESFYAVWVE